MAPAAGVVAAVVAASDSRYAGGSALACVCGGCIGHWVVGVRLRWHQRHGAQACGRRGPMRNARSTRADGAQCALSRFVWACGSGRPPRAVGRARCREPEERGCVGSRVCVCVGPDRTCGRDRGRRTAETHIDPIIEPRSRIHGPSVGRPAPHPPAHAGSGTRAASPLTADRDCRLGAGSGPAATLINPIVRDSLPMYTVHALYSVVAVGYVTSQTSTRRDAPVAVPSASRAGATPLRCHAQHCIFAYSGIHASSAATRNLFHTCLDALTETARAPYCT